MREECKILSFPGVFMKDLQIFQSNGDFYSRNSRFVSLKSGGRWRVLPPFLRLPVDRIAENVEFDLKGERVWMLGVVQSHFTCIPPYPLFYFSV